MRTARRLQAVSDVPRFMWDALEASALLYQRVLGALLLSLYRPPSVTPKVSGLPIGLHGGQSLIGTGCFMWQVAIWSVLD